MYPTPQLSALEQISQRRSVTMDLQGPAFCRATASAFKHSSAGARSWQTRPLAIFVFQDQARQNFGDQLAQRFTALKPGHQMPRSQQNVPAYARTTDYCCYQLRPGTPKNSPVGATHVCGCCVPKSVGRRQSNGFCRTMAYRVVCLRQCY